MQQTPSHIGKFAKNKTIQIHGSSTDNYQKEVMCCNVNIQQSIE